VKSYPHPNKIYQFLLLLNPIHPVEHPPAKMKVVLDPPKHTLLQHPSNSLQENTVDASEIWLTNHLGCKKTFEKTWDFHHGLNDLSTSTTAEVSWISERTINRTIT